MKRGVAASLAAWLLVPLLAGCAATAPATPPAASSARTNPAKAGAPAPRASVVPADSLPSEDALNVLKTIPEPLQPGEVVPPPESGALPAADSTGVAADSAAIVPTPAPTAPLGEGPGSSAQSSLADSLARMSGARAPSASGGGAGAGAAAAAGAGAAGAAGAASAGAKPGGAAMPDTCWRVQVAAPDDKDEAEAMRSAAESQLLVPMTSTFDGQRYYKVQTADCLTATSSDAIRARALSAGFEGAFRTRTVNAPPAAQPSEKSSPKPAPASPKPASTKKPAPKTSGK